MQFKHTLGQQDFMSRTENQEQSGERRERGKRGNEIAARRARETAGTSAGEENTILDEK